VCVHVCIRVCTCVCVREKECVRVYVCASMFLQHTSAQIPVCARTHANVCEKVNTPRVWFSVMQCVAVCCSVCARE